MSSRGLKDEESSPSNVLFRTHQYDIQVSPTDKFFDWAGRKNGFFLELKLFKQKGDTNEFCEHTNLNSPIVTTNFIETRGKLILTVNWPDDRVESWKGSFRFRLSVFRKVDEDTFIRVVTKVSSPFSIFSKPEVYTKKKRKSDETSIPSTETTSDCTTAIPNCASSKSVPPTPSSNTKQTKKARASAIKDASTVSNVPQDPILIASTPPRTGVTPPVTTTAANQSIPASSPRDKRAAAREAALRDSQNLFYEEDEQQEDQPEMDVDCLVNTLILSQPQQQSQQLQQSQQHVSGDFVNSLPHPATVTTSTASIGISTFLSSPLKHSMFSLIPDSSPGYKPNLILPSWSPPNSQNGRIILTPEVRQINHHLSGLSNVELAMHSSTADEEITFNPIEAEAADSLTSLSQEQPSQISTQRK